MENTIVLCALNMKYYIYRNMTIENFFSNIEATFSGYEDISTINVDVDRYVWFYLPPLICDIQKMADKIYSYTNMLKMTVFQLPKNKTLICFTMHLVFDINNIISDTRISDAVTQYNKALYHIASQNEQVKVIDFAKFLLRYSDCDQIDWKYYFISQMALNPRLAKPFKSWFEHQLDAIDLKRKKCLVLDLDNTLWGGILGEDGPNGIALGGDYPGKAFLYFQHCLEELNKQGIILSVCSKNNIDDVMQLWDEHPDNILNQKHFASCKINWMNKASNIQQIAEDLNISTDSMVFIDDNPAERALIQKMLPEVIVPDFPEQPYLLPPFIKDVAERYFSVYRLTKEDLNKTEQYKANLQRREAKKMFSNMDEYLKSLDIILSVREVNEKTLARIAQMTQKTNQFNLTTRRYTEMDIRDFINNNSKIYTLSVCDKFGDNGITGCSIITFDHNRANIDTFLLSCRILGKNIEMEFIHYILNELKKHGLDSVDASYIATAKNSQTSEFYDHAGLSLVREERGIKYYSLNLNLYHYTPSIYYK